MGVLLCLVEWFLFAASVLQYSLKLLSIMTQPLFMYLPNFFSTNILYYFPVLLFGNTVAPPFSICFMIACRSCMAVCGHMSKSN